jgi:hypothetical protein
MSFPARAPDVYSSRTLTIAANAAFVPIRIVTVLLGPLLPMLSTQRSLNYEKAGALFTVQFLALTVWVTMSGVCISRWGFRFAIKAGLLAMWDYSGSFGVIVKKDGKTEVDDGVLKALGLKPAA